MPITVERAAAHVNSWAAALSRFPTRATWPFHLFHTAQIEVAVEIIANDGVMCRSAVPELICDVANQGALWNNPKAHEYVRLYFRPRNGFHFKTEGIKTTSDPYRTNPHMAIPIAFAFDLAKVITLEKSYFVSGNFALSNQELLDGDSAFDQLDFSLIYHDSPPPLERMREIQNARMSEVVIERYLSLRHLSCVVCRTTHEERMLRYLLAARGLVCPKTIVEQRGAIFFKKAIFVDSIWWQSDELHLKFETPVSLPQSTYKLAVRSDDPNGQVVDRTYSVASGGPWRFPNHSRNPHAIWQISIEDCLAYQGFVPSTVGLIG